jgi:hypothetical protein
MEVNSMDIADIKQMICSMRAMGLNEQIIGLFVQAAHQSNTLLLD